VTPSRIVGLTRPVVRSTRLSKAIKASSVKEVRLGGKAGSLNDSVMVNIGSNAKAEKMTGLYGANPLNHRSARYFAAEPIP
jgi:hypothetical protein